MSKITYKCVIEFEYDSEEGAPLTGNPLNHPDEAIQAVRDELENGVSQLVIKCEVHDEQGFKYAISE